MWPFSFRYLTKRILDMGAVQSGHFLVDCDTFLTQSPMGKCSIDSLYSIYAPGRKVLCEWNQLPSRDFCTLSERQWGGNCSSKYVKSESWRSLKVGAAKLRVINEDGHWRTSIKVTIQYAIEIWTVRHWINVVKTTKHWLVNPNYFCSLKVEGIHCVMNGEYSEKDESSPKQSQGFLHALCKGHLKASCESPRILRPNRTAWIRTTGE